MKTDITSADTCTANIGMAHAATWLALTLIKQRDIGRAIHYIRLAIMYCHGSISEIKQ